MLREWSDRIDIPFCSRQGLKTEFGFDARAVKDRSAAKRMFEVLRPCLEQKAWLRKKTKK